MKYDDIIIGAGVSGLSAAILLAQNGRNVAVIEKSNKLAPTIRGFVRNNVYFDTGFHYTAMFGPEEPFTRLCDRLGILSQLEIGGQEKPVKECFCSIAPKFEFHAKAGLDNLMVQLTELFPADKEAIIQFQEKIDNYLNILNEDLFGVIINQANIFKNGNQTLSHYLQNNFKSPLLQTFLSSHAMLYGSLPEETSLEYHLMVTGGYYDQTCQVVNGGRAIAQTFEKEMQRHNISIFINSSVKQIKVNNNKAVESVVLEDGEVIACDNCIFTPHLHLLLSMLPKGIFRPVYEHRINSLEDTLSAVVLYCESEKTDTEAGFNNIILAHKLFPEMFSPKVGITDRPMYISHSISDKYAGGVSIICPWPYEDFRQWETSVTGKRDTSYYVRKEQISKVIVDFVQEKCQDKLGSLKVLDLATPLTFRDYMNAPNGCLYGTKHRASDMPFLSRTRIEGLYLSGQMLISAGVLGAMIAGFISAAEITKEDYIQTITQ